VSFLAPIALIGLVLAVPIVLMYMLRLRRREQIISSTFLWRQVLQDQEANTPWQRLRRNLLLFLQLLILALLVLALMRPFVSVPALSAARVAFVLDASASMAATDGGDGQTRFEAARAQAQALLDTLSGDTEITVIRAAARPELLTPYTTDRNAVRNALQQARVGAGEADWLAALTLAGAGAQDQPDFAVVLFTDGGLTETASFDASLIQGRVSVVPVGTASENIAISALSVRALPGGQPQLFAELTNTGVVDAEVVFILRANVDALPLVSERYSVPAGTSLPIVSNAPLPDDVRVLTANISPSVSSASRDLLPLDNTASVVLREDTAINILLVSEGNLFLEQVLSLLPGVRAFRASPSNALPAQPFDVIVFDRTLPERLPTAPDLLFIAPPTDLAGWFTVAESPTTGSSLRTTDDPRTAFVDVSTVSVLSYRALDSIAWAQPLITTEDGVPLVVAGERGGQQAAVFAFALSESDLPLNIAFPILMTNLIDSFKPASMADDGTGQAERPHPLRPPLDADTLRVTLPDGSVRELPVLGREMTFAETDQLGVYTVEAIRQGQPTQSESFAVNLFSPSESDIAPRSASLGGQPLQTNAADEQQPLELWPWVALLALAILLLEWEQYHRRQRLPTPPAKRPKPTRQKTWVSR
jgi:hypothetical protein